jgi:hypothetical protein
MFDSLRPNLFIRKTAERTRDLILATYPGIRLNVRSRLFQCWTGSSAANHYEVWLHERLDKIELGAHFEGLRAENEAFYNYLDANLIEIQAGLGSHIWLERWDHGWVRLYETVAMLPLDSAKVEDVAQRLCEIMDVLQPLLDHMPAHARAVR